MFEDTKGLIRIRKSKNKQHNGQKKVQKDKQRSTKHTHTTIDRVTRTPLNPGVNAGRVSSSCSTNGAIVLFVLRFTNSDQPFGIFKHTFKIENWQIPREPFSPMLFFSRFVFVTFRFAWSYDFETKVCLLFCMWKVYGRQTTNHDRRNVNVIPFGIFKHTFKIENWQIPREPFSPMLFFYPAWTKGITFTLRLSWFVVCRP
jgi:hypothetical protein